MMLDRSFKVTLGQLIVYQGNNIMHYIILDVVQTKPKIYRVHCIDNVVVIMKSSSSFSK